MEKEKSLALLDKCINELRNMTQEKFDEKDFKVQEMAQIKERVENLEEELYKLKVGVKEFARMLEN